MQSGERYDYIVVGAGSAGCVVANRLSADPGNRVLLLEAGGKDRNPLFRLPMLMGKLFQSGIYNWHNETEPEPHLNGRSLYWPRGKVLGGSSTINGMLYVRGNRHDYDRWAQMGLSGWSYDEVLPAFRRSEAHVQRADEYHGDDGELTVCRARSTNRLHDVFIAAGGEAGHPINDDFNGADQEGVGRYDFTIKDGKRWSTSHAFLRPIRQRANLTIQTNALSERIVIEDRRAVGVAYRRNRQSVVAHADREVVVCGGTVKSPHLLLLSGIGDPEQLGRHGIEIVHALPGVGRNLQDHVDCVMVYECTKPVTLFRDLRADRLVWSLVQGMVFGRGVATTFPYETGAFIRTRPELIAPDVQVHFMPALEKTANLHFPNPFRRRPSTESNHGFTLRVGPVNPDSRGTITLRSSDPDDQPVIRANYLAEETDLRRMIAGIRMTREIVAQDAFKPYRGRELAPGLDIECDEDIVRWLRETAMTTFHPVGTCKMGTGPDAVVDARLRVHGIEGLRVADASIMPIISSGNTNAPAIMIGEKAAEFMLGGEEGQ